jgi:DNA invertase Pin-like site-specific DNA recombinase
VRTLRERDANLRATSQPIDTSTAAGKCFLDMLGVFAEFETFARERKNVGQEGFDALVHRFAPLH